MSSLNLKYVLTKIAYATARMNHRSRRGEYIYMSIRELQDDKAKVSIVRKNALKEYSILYIEIDEYGKAELYFADCSECPYARSGECNPLKEVGCRTMELETLKEVLGSDLIILK